MDAKKKIIATVIVAILALVIISAFSDKTGFTALFFIFNAMIIMPFVIILIGVYYLVRD